MYGALWRHLPGPVAVRALICLVLVVAVVLLLFVFVFPAIEPHLPFTHDTVDPGTAPGASPSAAVPN